MKYRVIHWATGHAGRHAPRAIAQHPEMELIDPGFSSDALPIVLSSLSERIDYIRASEIFNYSIDGCVATAMRIVNAIPAVCDAAPGLKSWLDLPVIAGRHALRRN